MIPKIEWLDDPEIFQVNRKKAHSDHLFFESREAYEANHSEWMQSLNGEWSFCYSENAASRPKDFYKMSADTGYFDTIMVPGHIELAGYDKIHYINTMYPWEGKLYRRPAYSLPSAGDGAGMFSKASYNPVGSYLKKFDLEQGLLGKRVIICFEGVEQAMYVWLNGHFVGYAEDSFTPSEFDLTPWIQEKGNVLAVEVHKRSTAAYLEDQDFFRFFGIFRSVTLKAIPEIHLEDITISPVLKEDNQGVLSLDMKLSCEKEKHFICNVFLRDCNKKEHKVLLYRQLFSSDSQNVEVKSDENNNENSENIELEMTMHPVLIGTVEPWSNHSPYLYELIIGIHSEDGTLIELIPYRIGFRRLEMKDKVIYLNGERLVILGVNRHEWNARTGRNISLEDMKTDISTCLENHINAVRTSHYSNQIPWYYLCDENGIYLMAENNLESHGTWQKMGAIEPSYNVPGSIPQWREAVLDRATSNYELFKNHPSVLFWSLGNESYAGDNIAQMNAYYKSKEDGRLTHYEGVCQNRAYEDSISDVESRMYATPADIRAYLENEPKKPYLLCEYMHDMGNSLGGLGSYIKLLDEYPMFQGGFIWDFIDQALFVTDSVTGREVLRYGGDFDDKPSDYEYSGNGIVFADRTWKPALQEVRYYYGLHE